MYRLSAYYAARCLADLPVEVFNTTLFVTIVYFFGGLRLAAAAFFGNLLAMLLIVLVAQVIEWGGRGTAGAAGWLASSRVSGQHALGLPAVTGMRCSGRATARRAVQRILHGS